MGSPAAWRHEQPRLCSEQHHADGVLLPQHEVRQARRQEARVIPLGQRCRAERHRRRAIEQDVTAEVRLLLEALDIVVIGARKQRPIKILEVVTGTYSRWSANSTEKPWKGLLCRPLRKPSTTTWASSGE